MAATTIVSVRWARRLFRRLRRGLPEGIAAIAAVAVLSAPAAAQSLAAAPASASSPAATGAATTTNAVTTTTELQVVPSERSLPGAVRIEPVEEDYRIGTQDLIEVQVLGVQDLRREARVNAKGMIGLPLLGAVHVAGLTTGEAEALIAGLYRKDHLQNPEVSVFVKEFTRQRVTIEGAVARPGVFPLKGPTTLLQALAIAGGQGALSDLTDVVLFRMEAGERRAIKFDVSKIRSAEAPDPLLQPDDLIVVNRSPARVALRDSLFGDILQVIFNPFTSLTRP
jgi:polysaccharide export outer membrane protein